MGGTLTRRALPAVFKALREYVDNKPVTLTGEIKMYGGASAPAGYYLCDGSAKDTTIDAALFAVIGYSYGGSGTTFNLPNLTNKFARGNGANTGGGVDSHTHTSAAHSHTSSAHTHTSAAHSHPLSANGYALINLNTSNNLLGKDATVTAWSATWQGTGTTRAVSSASPTTAIQLSGATDPATPGSTGSTTPPDTGITTPANTGSANNIPAYTGVNFIIKA